MSQNDVEVAVPVQPCRLIATSPAQPAATRSIPASVTAVQLDRLIEVRFGQPADSRATCRGVYQAWRLGYGVWGVRTDQGCTHR